MCGKGRADNSHSVARTRTACLAPPVRLPQAVALHCEVLHRLVVLTAGLQQSGERGAARLRLPDERALRRRLDVHLRRRRPRP